MALGPRLQNQIERRLCGAAEARQAAFVGYVAKSRFAGLCPEWG